MPSAVPVASSGGMGAKVESGYGNGPVETNPENYRVVFENDRVSMLDYTDGPGHAATEHHCPDSAMIVASSFRRRLSSNGRSVDVELPAGVAWWLPGQDHYGENIGSTDTHAFFVELKEVAPDSSVEHLDYLGPIKLNRPGFVGDA